MSDESREPPSEFESHWIDSTSTNLVLRVKGADSRAWETVVRLYSPLVAAWCRKGGLGADDTADILQEVFVAALSGISRFRYDQPNDTFRGWLRVICTNKLRDFFRQRKDQPAPRGGTDQQMHWLILADPMSDQPDEETNRSETSTVLHAALQLVRQEFEDRTWTAFWRLTVDESSPDEVAAELAMTRAAVYKAKSRVLCRLRQVLGDSEP
jgi:RNA polymerase sigma-70 factor (ECF subfamily)